MIGAKGEPPGAEFEAGAELLVFEAASGITHVTEDVGAEEPAVLQEPAQEFAGVFFFWRGEQVAKPETEGGEPEVALGPSHFGLRKDQRAGVCIILEQRRPKRLDEVEVALGHAAI
jgi:hypothetical protein